MTQLRENLLKKWAYLKLGGELMGESRLAKVALLNRRLIKKTQDGSIGSATNEPEDSDMAEPVKLGDETHYHYPEKKSGSLLWPLATMALTAAMSGGIVGLVAGGLRRPAENEKEKVEVKAPVDVDADTRYELKLSTE